MDRIAIRDEALVAEARALAGLLGTTEAEAVRLAVREALAREQARGEERKRRLSAALLESPDRAAALPAPAPVGDQPGRYDQRGLPR